MCRDLSLRVPAAGGRVTRLRIRVGQAPEVHDEVPASMRLVMAMAAGSLVVVPSVNTRLTQTIGTRGLTQQAPVYGKDTREFYMTADDLGFIRPGFHLTVNSITIPEDRRPGRGLLLHRRLPAAARSQRASHARDRSASTRFSHGGTPTRGTTPPTRRACRRARSPAFRRRRPRRLGRDLEGPGDRPLDLQVQDRSPRGLRRHEDAHPGGLRHAQHRRLHRQELLRQRRARLPAGRRVRHGDLGQDDNAACNQCHDPLSAHGGSRQDVKLCVTCHQPQTVDPDTGNTVDFKVMVHKIHRGASLPSVEAGTPYIIIGNSQSVHDFSDVVFPQDIRNCADVPRRPKGDAVERLVHRSRPAPPAAPATTTSTG